MKVTSDTLATAAGAGMAVLNSVQTVAGQMTPGSAMHTQDYVNLAMSLIMLFLGWVTNRKGKEKAAEEPNQTL